MEFPNEHIIEDLYNSDLVTDIPSSKEYKDLLKEYNKLYYTIEDKNLRDKIEKLEEMKNKLYFANDKEIFKIRLCYVNKNNYGSINNKYINLIISYLKDSSLKYRIALYFLLVGNIYFIGELSASVF